MEYNFYLFSRLVHALIIDLNNWSIPYDTEFDLISMAYDEFKTQDHNAIKSTYDAMYDFINDNEVLYSTIRELNENSQAQVQSFNEKFALTDNDVESKIVQLLVAKNLQISEEHILTNVRNFINGSDSIDHFYFALNNWKYPIYLRRSNLFIYVTY